MTALGKAMADLEVADPEQQRVQEVKKRVRRKSKDLEDMMMELLVVAPPAQPHRLCLWCSRAEKACVRRSPTCKKHSTRPPRTAACPWPRPRGR